MDLNNAEWIISQHRSGTYTFDEEVVNKALELIKNSPYTTYECEFCEVEYTSRKNSAEEQNKLCHKCYLRKKEL